MNAKTKQTELMEKFNINEYDAKSVLQAVKELKITAEEAIEILNIKIVKDRKKSSAPVHTVFNKLFDMLKQTPGDEFNLDRESFNEFVNKTTKQIANATIDELSKLEGFNKIKRLIELKESLNLDSHGKVIAKIKKINTSIKRAFQRTGDANCISTNKHYVNVMQIIKNEDGGYKIIGKTNKDFNSARETSEELMKKRNEKYN